MVSNGLPRYLQRWLSGIFICLHCLILPPGNMTNQSGQQRNQARFPLHIHNDSLPSDKHLTTTGTADSAAENLCPHHEGAHGIPKQRFGSLLIKVEQLLSPALAAISCHAFPRDIYFAFPPFTSSCEICRTAVHDHRWCCHRSCQHHGCGCRQTRGSYSCL